MKKYTVVKKFSPTFSTFQNLLSGYGFKKRLHLKTYISKVNKLVYFRSSTSQTKKKSYPSSKTKNILAIHFALNYRLAFSSRNKLESTEMKANRCSLQEANQSQANRQGDCDHNGKEMHSIEISSRQPLPVRFPQRSGCYCKLFFLAEP